MSRPQRVAALVMALLVAGCAGARSGANESAAATSTGSPSAAPVAATPFAPLTGAAAASVRPGVTFPPAAHRPQTIHVFEDPIAFATVPVAGCTDTRGCVGDQLNGHSGMLDWATHADVGTLTAKCVMTDPSRNLYDCAITITLTGRGQVVFDESVVISGNGPQGPWPILSGSGEFLEATGSVGIPADSTCHCGNFVIAITG
jgi:hypothetical protein